MLKAMYAGLKEIKNPSFIQEWNDQQEKKVNSAIKKLFIMKTLEDHNGNKRHMHTMNYIIDFFGLPYTSSSSYAMISNTNVYCWIDEEKTLNIEHFALTTDNSVVMVVWDREENERFFVIG